MQVFATIIVFVSVLGSCLILALVWLIYKYRSIKHANAAAALASTDLPPTRQLTVVRGRVVDRMRAPSLKSSWSSLRSSIRRVPSSLATAEKNNVVAENHGKSKLGTIVWSAEEDMEKGEAYHEPLEAASHEIDLRREHRAIGHLHASPKPRVDDMEPPSLYREHLRRSIIDCLESAQSPDVMPSPTTTSCPPNTEPSTSRNTQQRSPLRSKFQIHPSSSKTSDFDIT